ncbi:MAG: hypothetical protein AAFR96_12155 [Planctomycetota bacterium]
MLETAKRNPHVQLEFDTQRRISLRDGRTRIADFVVTVRQTLLEVTFIIECQHRNRSKSEIVDKILAYRTQSAHSLCLFLYRESIPPSTSSALKDHGVPLLSLNQFREVLETLCESVALEGPSFDPTRSIGFKSRDREDTTAGDYMPSFLLNSAIWQVTLP